MSPTTRTGAGRTNQRNVQRPRTLPGTGQAGPQRRAAPFDAGRSLGRQPWHLVEKQLASAGADPSVALPRMRRYAELLLEWNRGFSNLISASDEVRLVERHILESLAPAAWIAEAAPKALMDFGSGGGFPAIPLAIAGVGERWVLVESRRNKTLFLRKALEEIGLQGISVELGRLELLLGEHGRLGRFDAFTSRATLRLGPTLALAANWVDQGGSAYLWKGSGRDQEMAEDRRWERSWATAGSFEVGSGQTSVVRFIRKNS